MQRSHDVVRRLQNAVSLWHWTGAAGILAMVHQGWKTHFTSHITHKTGMSARTLVTLPSWQPSDPKNYGLVQFQDLMCHGMTRPQLMHSNRRLRDEGGRRSCETYPVIEDELNALPLKGLRGILRYLPVV